MLKAPQLLCSLACMFAATGNFIYAQDSNAEILTLSIEQAAQRAWTQSRSVLIAQAQLAAAEAQSSSATSFLKPQVSLSGTYIHENEGEPFVGQSTLEDIYTTKIEVNQFLYGFGRRNAAQNASSFTRLAASADHDRIRNEASTLVKRAVTEVWLNQANILINESRVKQRQDEVNDAKALEAAGSVSPLDVRLAEINLASSQNSLASANGEKFISVLQVAQLLSLPISSQKESLVIIGDVNQDAKVSELLQQAKLKLLESSDLKVLNAQQEINKSNKDLLKSTGLPQFSALANYGGAGESIDDMEYQWQIGLGFSWSIYDGGARIADSANLTAQSQVLDEQYQQLVEAKTQSLAASEILFNTLQTNIKQQENIIQLAEKNYQDTRLLYKAGGTTITRVGDTSLALEEARFLLVQYKFQLHNLAITLQELIEQAPITQSLSSDIEE